MNYPEIAQANLALIPEFGRWDMLVLLLDLDELQDSILTILQTQLNQDHSRLEQGLLIPLCAKWLPREKNKVKIRLS